MGHVTKNNISPHIPLRQYPRAPDAEMMLRIIWGRGIFDRRSYKALMRHVDSHDAALDIGSHVGSWAIPMSRSFSRVIAFEPEPRNRSYLERNIERAERGNITVLPYAVKKTKSLFEEFTLRSGDATRNSGMPHMVNGHDGQNPADQTVKCVSLDDIMAIVLPDGARVGVMKIDVEGMELEVLKSGVRTVSQHMPAMLVEINSCCERYGISRNDIYEQLDSLGYEEVECVRNDHIFVPR